jgi:hypothetical protein
MATGFRNGRPPKPKTIIRDACLGKDIEDALWAMLYAQQEHLADGEVSAVSTTLIAHLVGLEKAKYQWGGKKVGKDDAKDNITQINDWLKAVGDDAE